MTNAGQELDGERERERERETETETQRETERERERLIFIFSTDIWVICNMFIVAKFSSFTKELVAVQIISFATKCSFG